MRKEVFYRVIIVALLLLNFGVLGYLWMGKKEMHQQAGPEGDRRKEPAEFIIKSLQLDEQQQMKFEELKHEHQHNMQMVREESKNLHDALYKELHKQMVDSNVVDSFMQLIVVNAKQREMVNFNHFRDLKTILKPEQYKLYDEFIEAIAHRFGPPPPPHH